MACPRNAPAEVTLPRDPRLLNIACISVLRSPGMDVAGISSMLPTKTDAMIFWIREFMGYSFSAQKGWPGLVCVIAFMRSTMSVSAITP